MRIARKLATSLYPCHSTREVSSCFSQLAAELSYCPQLVVKPPLTTAYSVDFVLKEGMPEILFRHACPFKHQVDQLDTDTLFNQRPCSTGSTAWRQKPYQTLNPFGPTNVDPVEGPPQGQPSQALTLWGPLHQVHMSWGSA